MINTTWEQVLDSAGFVISYRLQVPGGWLVQANQGITFFADPTYTWNGVITVKGSSSTTSAGGTSTTTTGTATTTSGTTTTTTSGTSAGSTTGSSTATTGSTSTTGTSTTSSSTSTTTSSGSTTATGSTSSTTTASNLAYIWNNGSVQNGWRDYSYTGTYTVDAYGDKVGLIGAYGAMSFNNNNDVSVMADGYTGIQLTIKSDGKQSVSVGVFTGETSLGVLAITPTTAFETITITWAQLGFSSSSNFTNVVIENITGTALADPVVLMNLALIVNTSASTTTASGTGTTTTTSSLPPIDPTPVSGANALVNWLTVKGNKIVDSITGEQYVGRGLCIEDPNLGGMGIGTSYATGAQEVIRRINWAYNLGCDYFRLLLQEFDSSGNVDAAGDICNNPTYLAAIKTIVAYIGTLPGARVGITVDIQYTLDPPVGGAPTLATIPTLTQLVYSFYQCPWCHIIVGNEPEYTTAAQESALITTYEACVAAIRTAENVVGTKNRMLVSLPGVSNYARNVEYFLTNPVVDAYNSVIYTCHIYDAVPATTSDPWAGQYITAAASIPLMCDEFGPASPMTLAECAAWQTQLETLKTPYAGWALSMQESPTMLVDTSNGGNGVGAMLELTAWGLQFINQLRAAKGLAAVNNLGVVST